MTNHPHFRGEFDDLNECTHFIVTSVLIVWSGFLFIGIPVGVVHFSYKLINQNQPTCEEVTQ